jgi:hypothetical protein
LQDVQKKFTNDSKHIKKEKVRMEEMTKLTKEIIKDEKEINLAMNNIKYIQDSIAQFLVKENNKRALTKTKQA